MLLCIIGRFEYKVTKAGKIYYNSGFIDSFENIQYSAIVYVQDRNQSVGHVTLKVKEHEAVYDVNSGEYRLYIYNVYMYCYKYHKYFAPLIMQHLFWLARNQDNMSTRGLLCQ
jgi:hypothetical protein